MLLLPLALACFDGAGDEARHVVRFYGEQAQDRMGQQVSWAGDVDGDGHHDLLLGLFNRGGGHSGQAVAWLMTGPIASAATLDDAAVWFERQPDAGSLAYTAVGAGDMDGDGLGEVLIGHDSYAPASDPGTGGVIYLFRGAELPSGGVALGDEEPWLMGVEERSHLGALLARAGDTDGDGLADVLSQDWGKGQVMLFRRPTTTGGLAQVEAATVFQECGLCYFGNMVFAGGGDTDGDGLDDVIISSPGYDNGEDAGIALLFRAPFHRTIALDEGWAEAADQAFAGVSGEDYDFGYAISIAGDVDGDGLADVLLGEPTWGFSSGQSLGRALLFPGDGEGRWGAEHATAIVEGTGDDSHVGQAVDLGDFDADGHADLVVTSLSPVGDSSGATYWFRGPVEGVLTTDASDRARRGDEQDDFGWSVAVVGDVQGSGGDDLLVGAPQFDGDANGYAAFFPAVGLF